MDGPVRPLPDADARRAALAGHDRTLLVEAGAGSGKTALMAGRVALLVAAGVAPRDIVAITFTEAAAAELRERVEGYIMALASDEIPIELGIALPDGLEDSRMALLQAGKESLDEISCTTIHGFCQQLIRPYPVETDLDPGATIIDPASAELAYDDLMHQWLSGRFGADTGDGSGEDASRASPDLENSNLFVQLLLQNPDETLKLIRNAARLLKEHPAAQPARNPPDPEAYERFATAVENFAQWYESCGADEHSTAATIADLRRASRDGGGSPPESVESIVELLSIDPPSACKSKSPEFKVWRVKGRWKAAAKSAGLDSGTGEALFLESEAHYLACGEAYGAVASEIAREAFVAFVKEFDELRRLYRRYKRDAALLDFDDLLYRARDLLKSNDEVRTALADRYPRILVDEFQDTDPLQAEILWRLAGEGAPGQAWHDYTVRPGALFLAGDPKQAIYRFRGADAQIYQRAKESLLEHDSNSVLEITANFRTRAPILGYVNDLFEKRFGEDGKQPDFARLQMTRPASEGLHVAALDVPVEDLPRGKSGALITQEVRRAEAQAVAKTLQGMIGSYPVWDKEEQRYRPARPGDIALLAPAGTGLWMYEHALETEGTPIATQAGKGFFRRQEVQDLIAIARAITDARDTLGFGALIRGPLVGLTEEQIADEIAALPHGLDSRLFLWTPLEDLGNPVLRETMGVLQGLARKVYHTTPHLLMADAVEALHVRAIVKARHPRGAERALANIEYLLEMAKAYDSRGMVEFASNLRRRWNDSESQAEGRPDAQTDAVSITTMHSAKGLEWSVVIPINSMTVPMSEGSFLYRRQDDSVHFRIFGHAGPGFEAVKQEEQEELARERVRLWYVALTRARDVLLLPRLGERSTRDWFSLIAPDLASLPALEGGAQTQSPSKGGPPVATSPANEQDKSTWLREERLIAGLEREIEWQRPSHHEAAPDDDPTEDDDVFVPADEDSTIEVRFDSSSPQGRFVRGEILHKLIEEVLTGETANTPDALLDRARDLMWQLGQEDSPDANQGLSSAEISATAVRGLEIPLVARLLPRLVPEFRVYGGQVKGGKTALTAGIVDAIALDDAGRPEAVIDWKSDVDPSPDRVREYRKQVIEYLTLTGAPKGYLVFLTQGHVIDVSLPGS